MLEITKHTVASLVLEKKLNWTNEGTEAQNGQGRCFILQPALDSLWVSDSSVLFRIHQGNARGLGLIQQRRTDPWVPGLTVSKPWQRL